MNDTLLRAVLTKYLIAVMVGLGLLLAWSFASSAVNDATLNWTAPTQYEDDTVIISPITYTVIEEFNGTSVVRIKNLSSTTYLIPPPLEPGKHCWRLRATVNGVDSKSTLAICKTVPEPSVPPPVSKRPKIPTAFAVS